MAIVKCKVEWQSDGWSYIVLQGNNQLRYTKIPTRIIHKHDDIGYIYVEIVKDKGESFKCKLKDVRYDDYYFIKFSISKDQFIDNKLLENKVKYLYQLWCEQVYRDEIGEKEYWEVCD